MANKLKDMVIDEASFVDRPANKLARIVFFKRDGEAIDGFQNEEFLGGCTTCGYGTRELISKSDKCPFCWTKPVQKIEKTTFFKREMEDRTMKVLPGQSEKDTIWAEMQRRFDELQRQTNDAGFRQQGSQFTPQSREKMFAKWLTGKEGSELYEKYQAASDAVTPVQKSEEPTNLREFAWQELEKIAEKFQKGQGGTIEQAHRLCAKESREYSAIYSLIHDSFPLDEMDFSERISKSKSDAIGLVKARILVEASKAGV